MDSNLDRPNKKLPRDSIDGMVPTRNPRLTNHRYYRSPTNHGSGPRRPLANQARLRRPHQPDPSTVSDQAPEKPVQQIGDFSKDSSNIFDESFIPRKPAKAKKDKKQKKEPGKLRNWWKNKSLKFKFGLISLIILLIGGGLLGARLYSFLNSVFAKSVGNSSSAALNKDIDPSQLNTEGDGRLNILMLGRGGTENEAPDLTDTMLIASIDLKNQSASLLSVPRDMWVNVNGSNMKINAAYSTGKMQATYKGKNTQDAENEGIKTAISAIRNVSGVPIHKYVLTDYKAFRDVVNALGGVDINVAEPIYDGFTGWRFKAGAQTMNGETALKYARTRHGSARGDFDRNEHQRQLLVAMRQKATSTGIVANPVRLNSLANAVQKNIRTDLSLDEAKTLFDKTKMLSDSNIKSLDLADPKEPLVTTGSGGGVSIVRPVTGLQDYTKIRSYARTNMMDPYLRKEAPTVAVYNASGEAGVATLVGDVLSGYGYKVLTKETSNSTQTKTQVIKMSKVSKPFTDRFLTVRFKTVLGTSLPANVVPAKKNPTTTNTDGATTTPSLPEPDYIIIFGTDWDQPSGPTW